MDLAAIVGLGNPGEVYAANRHNAGFMVVDELARRWRVGVWRHRSDALVGRRGGGQPVWLVKPQTFMNRSGEAVRMFCAREGLEPSQCLVVVDDVELSLGQLRLRERGGPGTHNGLRSVVEHLGEGFPRLRLGIRGAAPWDDLAGYVLADFDRGEVETVDAMVARASDCAAAAVRVGLARAASDFNRAPADPDGE
jgi:PTH1 family peptidyl-tRNA hydrolase